MNNKFSVGIDYQSAAQQGKSGVGYYTEGMVVSLAKAHPELDIYLHYYNFLSRSRVRVPDLPNVHAVQSCIIHPKLVNLLRRFSIHIPFTLLLKKRCAAYFFPSFTNYPVPKKSTVITTVHDLAYLDVPESVSARNRSDLIKFTPTYIRRSTKIATVSNDAKSSIKKYYPGSPEIFVTYSPPSHSPQDQAKASALPKDTPKNYILFVGNLEPRKNLVRLLEAYGKLEARLQKKFALVLAGGGGWNNQEITADIKELRNRGLTVSTPGYVSESQLQALYKNAVLFAFPTLYEGYGIPPLEAMSFNVPVVASDIPVLKEVCQYAAYYCDPNNSNSIAGALTETLTNVTIRKKLQSAGRARVEKITWQKAADILYKHLTT